MLKANLKELDSGSSSDQEEISPEKAAIHSLPTELLVLIFSMLSVDDLSSNVSKVCQRWREAMQFRSLWHSRELLYQNDREDSFVFVLSVAASLKKLILTPLFCEDPSLIVSAILKGPKDIQEVHYNLSLFPFDAGARILGHFKDYVCELHLEGDAEKQSCRYRNLGAVLREMTHLKSLTLSGYFDSNWGKNVLTQGHMELHHLDVSDIQDVSPSYLPLLDSVKDTLRTLRLPKCRSDVRVLSVVACCSKPKEITLCLDDLRCVSSLLSLESLHIKWCEVVPRWKMNQFVRECPVFGNLKELTLHYIPGPIASAIAKCCHRLEVLNMHGITSCADIIKAVPSVRKLCVFDRLSLRMRHVQKIPRYLPQLTHLDLQGCFVNRGIPPKIVQKLKSELPGVKIVCDQFSAYSKRSNKGYCTKCTDSSTDCSSDEA